MILGKNFSADYFHVFILSSSALYFKETIKAFSQISWLSVLFIVENCVDPQENLFMFKKRSLFRLNTAEHSGIFRLLLVFSNLGTSSNWKGLFRFFASRCVCDYFMPKYKTFSVKEYYFRSLTSAENNSKRRNQIATRVKTSLKLFESKVLSNRGNAIWLVPIAFLK